MSLDGVMQGRHACMNNTKGWEIERRSKEAMVCGAWMVGNSIFCQRTDLLGDLLWALVCFFKNANDLYMSSWWCLIYHLQVWHGWGDLRQSEGKKVSSYTSQALEQEKGWALFTPIIFPTFQRFRKNSSWKSKPHTDRTLISFSLWPCQCIHEPNKWKNKKQKTT